MTETFIGISYVGGREFLDRAIASVGGAAEIVVLNSSGEPLCLGVAVVMPGCSIASEIEPFVPLTHTQTHNYFARMAGLRGAEFYMVMHADAEANPETVLALAERARQLCTEGRRWYVLFTNYDYLCAYNVAAWTQAGGWDWQLFPSYYSECDFYYRCRVAGYEPVESGLTVKHVGSHIINHVDKWRKLYTSIRMDQWAATYVAKWGGHPGHEVYKRPFDIDERGPYPDL